MTQRPVAAGVGDGRVTVTVGGGMAATSARFRFTPRAYGSASVTIADIEAVDKDGFSIEVMVPAPAVVLLTN